MHLRNGQLCSQHTRLRLVLLPREENKDIDIDTILVTVMNAQKWMQTSEIPSTTTGMNGHKTASRAEVVRVL